MYPNAQYLSVLEMEGAALDYCVALAAKVSVTLGRHAGGVVVYAAHRPGEVYAPSADWALGGPLLQLAGINVSECNKTRWHAHSIRVPATCFVGRTPLEAAMRCFVAMRFGLRAPELPPLFDSLAA
jgi:hypothetical protein